MNNLDIELIPVKIVIYKARFMIWLGIFVVMTIFLSIINFNFQIISDVKIYLVAYWIL